MPIPRFKQDAVLIAALAVSTCAVTGLALFKLIQLNEATPPTAAPQSQARKTSGDIERGGKSGVNRYAVRVDLSHQQLTPSQMAQLAELQYMKDLDLSGASLPAEGIDALKGKDLSVLDLHGTDTKDPGEVLQRMPHLARLDLSGTPIKDPTIVKLAHAPALLWLDLQATGITDKALQSVAQMPVLERLALSGSRITDDGLRDLTTAPHLTRLRLVQTQVTVKGVKTLLKACPTLKFLAIQSCPHIGPYELLELKTGFPDCKIVVK